MASESEDDGLEELEFEPEYDEDDTGLIDAQEEATEDGDEVCTCSIAHWDVYPCLFNGCRSLQKTMKTTTTMRTMRMRMRSLVAEELWM